MPNQYTNMADNTNIQKTSIDGLYIVGRPIYKDNRGFFREIYQSQELKKFAGVDFNPVQFNHSLSQPKVIRGVHADPGPYLESHDLESDSSKVTWYGFTKAEAERRVDGRGSILRLIYPVRSKYPQKLDYIRKTLGLYQ